jgi:hypothetical protein
MLLILAAMYVDDVENMIFVNILSELFPEPHRVEQDKFFIIRFAYNYAK